MGPIFGTVAGLLSFLAIQLAIDMNAGKLPIGPEWNWLLSLLSPLIIGLAFIFSNYEQERDCVRDRKRQEAETEQLRQQRDAERAENDRLLGLLRATRHPTHRGGPGMTP